MDKTKSDNAGSELNKNEHIFPEDCSDFYKNYESTSSIINNTSEISNGETLEKLALESEKYWSANTDKRKDLSHWRGTGRWKDEKNWFNIGQWSLGNYRQFARMINFNGALNKVIEWGPGGGSNAVAFAKEVGTYYGVDISEDNLKECAKQMAEAGYPEKFRPIYLSNPAKPEDVLSQAPAGEFDLFLSTAVFQHFPGKEYAIKVMKSAFQLVKPGGLAIIQIRFDDGRPKSITKNSNYEKNAIFFTSFYIPEFWYIAEKIIGFKPISISLALNASYAVFFMQKKQ